MTKEINKTKVLTIALGLPSMIFASAFILMKLSEEGILEKHWALIIFFVFIANLIYLLIYTALKK